MQKQVRESELEFKEEWPIEQVAGFISDCHTEPQIWKMDGKEVEGRKRKPLTQKQAVEKVKGILGKPESMQLFLTRNGELIGCVFAYKTSKEDIEKDTNKPIEDSEMFFAIREVNIKSGYRGQGLGRTMMEEIIHRTEEKGAKELFLTAFTEEGNPAFHLYKNLGFRKVVHGCMLYGCKNKNP